MPVKTVKRRRRFGGLSSRGDIIREQAKLRADCLGGRITVRQWRLQQHMLNLLLGLFR